MQGHSWTRGGRAQKKAILSILFFQDEVTFFVIGDFYVIFGDFLVGTGEPPPYWDKITVLYGCGFGFKKSGLGQPPHLLSGTKSQL